MDIVTHSLLGANLSRTKLGGQLGGKAAIILVTASLLPDVDVLWVLAGSSEATLGRRLLTHSVPGIAVLSVLAAVLFKTIYSEVRFRVAFGLCLAAISLHVFFDILNSFGVALLYPFSDFRFELPFVFVVDPVIILLLLVPLLLPMMSPRFKPNRRMANAALTGVGVYIALCGGARFLAADLLADHIDRQGQASEFAYLVPEPLGPFSWKGVYGGDGLYHEALVRPFGGRVDDLGTLESMENLAEVQKVRRNDLARRVETFMKFPVWEARDGIVLAYDLRFRYAALNNQWDPFSFRFVVAGDDVELSNWSPREYVENAFSVLGNIESRPTQ